MGVEDRLEAATVPATRDAREAPAEPRNAPRLDQGQEEEEQNEDREADDDDTEVRLDEGVQIDRTVLRQAS